MLKKVAFIFALFFLTGSINAAPPVYHAYLPWFGNQKTECGTEVWRNTLYTPQLDFFGCQYVRYNAGTETTPGLYRTWKLSGMNWSSLAFYENDLETLRAQNTLPVAVFHGNAQGTCAQVPENEYQAYANFVTEAVTRWNLEYIEVWNEGDALGGLPYLFGCWGKENTTSYLQFLSTIAKTVWATHPDVKVITSLMTDTTASIPMLQALSSAYQNEPRFVLGFHHYQPYGGLPAWSLSDKVTTIRGFWGGALWLTETNMTKWSETGVCLSPTQGFQRQQAVYIATVKNTIELDNYFVYGMGRYNGSWRCAALLLDTFKPNPAYKVIQPAPWPYP